MLGFLLAAGELGAATASLAEGSGKQLEEALAGVTDRVVAVEGSVAGLSSSQEAASGALSALASSVGANTEAAGALQGRVAASEDESKSNGEAKPTPCSRNHMRNITSGACSIIQT